MEDTDAIAALQDPVRRRLYEYVVAQGREVGRSEAAEAAGVARTLAAHHPDRLTEGGLLEGGSRRLTGRSGPGAGRPAKVYTRARVERVVSLPARDYRTAAELLAEASEQAGLDAGLCAAVRRRGEALRGSARPAAASKRPWRCRRPAATNRIWKAPRAAGAPQAPRRRPEQPSRSCVCATAPSTPSPNASRRSSAA
ncbi:transcriptional regulator [Streptomyces sp. NPDC001792]|uniref:transcriptional regulator n=1 Tax=Streptomyces sp. NPDC001792 TaxID=3154524 RepID=UPI0033342DB6